VKHRLLLVVALLSLIGAATGAERSSLDVRVVGIADGDTITVLDSLNTQRKVRIAGIDAPEGGQPFGDRSKQNLSRLIQGRSVHIEWSKADRYGRLIAIVTATSTDTCTTPPCPPTFDAGLAQIRAGMAWHDKEYEKDQSPSDRRDYAAAEQQARAARIGLWADRNPAAPSDWRRGLTDGPVKKSRSNICHDTSSPSYKATTKFESFPTLDACLASGGRRPKGP
jgi:endonuclease YncB( thermonuclease family)